MEAYKLDGRDHMYKDIRKQKNREKNNFYDSDKRGVRLEQDINIEKYIE